GLGAGRSWRAHPRPGQAGGDLRRKGRALVNRLADQLQQAAARIGEPGRTQLRETARLWVLYVEGFRACARACFSAQYAHDHPEPRTRDRARQELTALDAYRSRLAQALEGGQTAYLVGWMLDCD